tara:strand:+ start:1895 stop:3532 length:1638 start_codon:yes stop_codon:yes gene_type:complete
MRKTLIILTLLFVNITSKSVFSQCAPPSAFSELDINNVSAGLMNGGDLWWDGIGLPKYEYPKYSGRLALFAGAIWLSALDDNGKLLTSAMKYRNTGYEFYPGPINSTTGTVSSNSCIVFDRFWEIHRIEIQNHLNNVTLGMPVPLSQIDDAILQWPAKGNTHFNNYVIQDDLAPFKDFNNNGIYDPENGDYPDIKGDQAIFWVINDIGGVHGITNGDPIGVEVHFLAYAYYNPSSALNDATFYDIKVIKKTTGNASDFYMGLFVDPDLGNPADDFIGCDTLTNSGFAYNGDAFDDDQSGRPGYGQNTPIISTTFLNKTMNSFSSPTYAPNATGDAVSPVHYRNYLKGFWRDGTAKTIGGTGFGGTIPTSFMYFSNPASPSPAWSEVSVGNAPGDRRYIQSTGPYSLNWMEPFDISFVTIAHNVMGSNDVSVSVIPTISQIAQLYTDTLASGNKYDFALGINPIDESSIAIYPNPVTHILTIDLKNLNGGNIRIVDVNGREVYQGNANPNSQVLNIDMSIYENGFYVLSVEVNDEKRFYKILNSHK